jgi:predicted Zn finger-like uncharacterized protein
VAEDSLEPLITQCPTCRTRFRVTELQLNAAAGRVRCGACLSVFAGLEHLVLGAGPKLKPGESPNEALDALLDELRKDPAPEPRDKPAGPPPKQPEPAQSVSPQRNRANTETLAKSKSAVADEPAHADDDGDDFGEIGTKPAENPRETVEAPPPDVDPVASRRARRLKLAASKETKAPEPEPDQAEEEETVEDAPRATPAVELDIRPEDLLETPRRRKRRWWMPVVLVLAIIALTGQVFYWQFDVWAKNPDIRPVYEWICPRLNCQLPVMRSLDEIRSKNLVVRANPDVPGELMVDALIVNQARFAQPFPVIELRFSSMDGRPIAARRFKPEEYLAGELKGATMFVPMTPVHIALSIEDPGTDAVSYYIQFR